MDEEFCCEYRGKVWADPDTTFHWLLSEATGEPLAGHGGCRSFDDAARSMLSAAERVGIFGDQVELV